MKNITTTIISVFALACFAYSARAAAPVVTNVVASQRIGTKLIDIRYDVFDADGDPLKIRIEISHNGGSNYSVPAITLSGDLGNNITPGTNKLIVWNAAGVLTHNLWVLARLPQRQAKEAAPRRKAA